VRKVFTVWALELVNYRNIDARHLLFLPRDEAENFPFFPHFPHAARCRSHCRDIAERQVTRPLWVPGTVATELGARALDQPHYFIEDRRIARMARDCPLERVALDRCQLVVGGATS